MCICDYVSVTVFNIVNSVRNFGLMQLRQTRIDKGKIRNKLI